MADNYTAAAAAALNAGVDLNSGRRRLSTYVDLYCDLNLSI
jgi:UDP-N-acetylmuramyl pentapeptide synthase